MSHERSNACKQDNNEFAIIGEKGKVILLVCDLHFAHRKEECC